jgi:hypothetical protein
MRIRALTLAAALGVVLLPPGGLEEAGGDVSRPAAFLDSSFVLADSVQSLLSGVIDIRVAPDRSVYLSDRSLPFVVHIDPSGALRRIIGRAGSGPGEFIRPAFLGWRGDSLWVHDLGLVRLTLFDTAGRGFSTFPVLFPQRPAVVGQRRYAGQAQPTALLADGDLLVYRGPPRRDSGLPPEAWVLKVSRDYQVRDTVTGWRSAHPGMAFQFRDAIRSIPQPFSDDPVVDFSPDGRWFLRIDRPAAAGDDPATLGVTLMEDGERVTYRREFRYTPLPLPRDTIESFISHALDFDVAPGQIRVPLTRDSIDGQLYRPRYYPPVVDARVGRDGTVWFRLMEQASGGLLRRGQAQWVALGPHGFELTRVVTPARLMVYDVDRQSLWGVEYDADGVPAIRHYLVPAGPPRGARRSEASGSPPA